MALEIAPACLTEWKQNSDTSLLYFHNRVHQLQVRVGGNVVFKFDEATVRLIPQFDGNRDDAPQTGRVIFQHRGVHVVGLARDNFYNYVEALRILPPHLRTTDMHLSALSVRGIIESDL